MRRTIPIRLPSMTRTTFELDWTTAPLLYQHHHHPRPPTMSSKSICSRCLRLATSSAKSSSPSTRTAHRVFSTTTSKQPLQTRRIHNASSHRAAQPSTSQAKQTPPDLDVRGRRTDKPSSQPDESRLLLKPNNLFHSFTNSPSPIIRKRAAVIRQNAYCPHPAHGATRTPTSPGDPESLKTGAEPPAHVRYECPDCGIPVSCSAEHFVDDYESHLELCDVLREINEDDHDLVSGRFFPEFEYPGPQIDEAMVNMTNWDTLLFSREFNAINEERPMRQVTRLLTYPITIGSVLHELSPYSMKGRDGRLTAEGLKSLSGKPYPSPQPHRTPTNSFSPSQPFATPSTHPVQAQVPPSPASAPTPHQSASSSSARAPNPPSPAKSGCNSPISSPAALST